MAAPRRDNIREKILSAAEALIEERKVSAVSLADIAAKAGVSKGTVYYYYKNKDDILLDITDKYLDRQLEDLITWTEDETKDTSLHRLIKYVLRRDMETSGMRLNLFYDAASGNNDLREKLIKRYAEFTEILSEKIAERTDSVSPDYLARLLLLLSDGLCIHQNIADPLVDTDTFIAESEKYLQSMAGDN